jgi:hypothetical protein
MSRVGTKTFAPAERIDLVLQYAKESLPGIAPIEPDASFLVWLDAHELDAKVGGIQKYLVEKAGVNLYDVYDVVCLLTSQCREITFQLNTAIPLERVLAIASSFRADKLPPRLLQRLLLTFDTRDRALNRSLERAALASPPQEDVDQVTFAQLARDHDLSLSELEELYRQAARLLIEGFQRRQTHALPSSVTQQAIARPSSTRATMPST